MLSADEIRDVNVRYHDAAAEGYDSKWGIDYGERGAQQVLTKLSKALGDAPGCFDRALEIGAGTGYFSINLLKLGIVREATATDISPGMLRQLAATAERLGIPIRTVRADAEALPFKDETFDLVLGHAVLHHLPALQSALEEFRRVLAPGGTLAFMGEPSHAGDRLASMPKRLGTIARPAWRLLFSGDPEAEADDKAHAARRYRGEREPNLEFMVDVHVFSPAELRDVATAAGFVDVRVSGEELLASAYGWLLRSLQAGSDPDRVPRLWHRFAFQSYLALQWLDGNLLEPRLPAGLFYNLLLSARRPS